MADGDEPDDGEFVFGEERPTDTDAADGQASRRTVAAAVLFVVVIALVAAYPFVSGAVTGLFGDDSSAGDGGAEPTAIEPTATVDGSASTATGAPGERTGTTGAAERTNTTPTATTVAGTRTSAATPTPTSMATATTTPTETAAPVAPMIESFSVTDRSDNGTARFGVDWNVTDADGDLVAVRVRLVAPDGEARTVAQRRFDAGGTRSSGETTFEVAKGGGTAYTLSIEVVDTNGNTAFELTREVADGSSDG